MHRCEGDSGEKKVERRRKREKLKGNGLWSSLKSGVLGVSKLGFLSKDEYNQKIEKLEMVFSSVCLKASSFFRILFLLFLHNRKFVRTKKKVVGTTCLKNMCT